MREILFRAKRVDNGEWVEGSLCNRHDSFGSLSTIEVCTNSDVFIYEQFQVIPETVGQFTGLLDKNGKKVFEGDVLIIFLPDGEIDYQPVSFQKGTFMLGTKTPDRLYRELEYWGSRIELFSTIHDQPVNNL